MDSKTEMMEAIELLKWQLELGVDENIGNSPIDRFSEITLDPDPKKKIQSLKIKNAKTKYCNYPG